MEYAASESLYEALSSNPLTHLDALGLVPSKLPPWSCCADSKHGISTAELTQTIQVGHDVYTVEWRLVNKTLTEFMSGGVGVYGGASACNQCNWTTLVAKHVQYKVTSGNNPCPTGSDWDSVRCPGSTGAHQVCKAPGTCNSEPCCQLQNALYRQWHGDSCRDPAGQGSGCGGSSSPAWPKWNGAGTNNCDGSSQCYLYPDTLFTTTLACPGSVAQAWSVKGAPLGGGLQFGVTWKFECPK